MIMKNKETERYTKMDNVQLKVQQVHHMLLNAQDPEDILDLWKEFCRSKSLRDFNIKHMYESHEYVYGSYILDMLEHYYGDFYRDDDYYFVDKDGNYISFTELNNDYGNSRSPISFKQLAEWIVNEYQEQFKEHYENLFN